MTAGPRRRRRRRTRKITLTLALVLAGLALIGGILVGYAARGDPPPGGMLTEDRSVPVVTITGPPVTVTVTGPGGRPPRADPAPPAGGQDRSPLGPGGDKARSR